MNMNFKKILSLGAVLGFVIAGCNENDDLVTENAQEGGLLTVTSTSLNYVVGNPEGPYGMEFYVNQVGKQGVNKINLYKSFTSTVKTTKIVDGEEVEYDTTFTSNEVLDRTITVSGDNNDYVSTAYTLGEMIEGLTVASLNGPAAALPTDDGLYNIGDKWVFRVETVMDDGRVVQQSTPVAVSVSTRYAGKYRAVKTEYYRLGVLTYTTADWPDETVIESVDATTYRVLEYFGAEAFSGNEYYFQIDGDGNITYPAKKPNGEDQVGNDQPFLRCGDMDPATAAQVHCGESNMVINDDVSGKDRLVMSFGYNTTSGATGPRSFYQVLEKIVE
jgi:hypothetical protein